MSNISIFLDRNRQFATDFAAADLPGLPRSRTVLLTCADPRVDPAHVLGLELGEVAVIRNNGGRVTQAVVDEIATLAFMVARIDGDEPRPWELVLMQHTKCGAERFADPDFQHALKEHIGVDVSPSGIADYEQSVREDVERLRGAPNIPGYLVVSALMYDVETGQARQVIPAAPLRG